MGNVYLYPQRATEPIDLDEQIDFNENLTNISLIVKSLTHLKIDTLWIAWGDIIETREYLKFCLYKLNSYLKLNDIDLKIKIIDTPTMAGNPRHPLYKKSNSELYDFDMETYISEKVTKSILKKYEKIELN